MILGINPMYSTYVLIFFDFIYQFYCVYYACSIAVILYNNLLAWIYIPAVTFFWFNPQYLSEVVVTSINHYMSELYEFLLQDSYVLNCH